MPGAVTFGLALYTGQQLGPVDPDELYADAVPLARAAESAGFDTFWVSEHHGLEDGYTPAPLSILAAVASCTSRIGLGTGVLLAPLRHPLRIAEEAAVVDRLSRGRLILGLGLGYTDDELRGGQPSAVGRGARLEETIAILRLAWRGERFSFDGDAYRVDSVQVTPRPYRGREIPILIGAYAPAARRRAARLADGHLVGRGAPAIVDAAIAEIDAAGGPARSPFSFAVNLALVLDEARGHATEALDAFAAQQLVYERMQRGRDVYSGQVEEAAADDGTLTLGRIEEYLQGRGSAEHVADAIRSTIAAMPPWATPHIGLRIVFPERDVAKQVERIAAFGERVLPLARD